MASQQQRAKALSLYRQLLRTARSWEGGAEEQVRGKGGAEGAEDVQHRGKGEERNQRPQNRHSHTQQLASMPPPTNCPTQSTLIEPTLAL